MTKVVVDQHFDKQRFQHVWGLSVLDGSKRMYVCEGDPPAMLLRDTQGEVEAERRALQSRLDTTGERS